MDVHNKGKPDGKSHFLYQFDAEKAVLDASAYADNYSLWDNGNQAKIHVKNQTVGVLGDSGLTTDWIEVTRTNSGYVHGWSCKAP